MEAGGDVGTFEAGGTAVQAEQYIPQPVYLSVDLTEPTVKRRAGIDGTVAPAAAAPAAEAAAPAE
jgi:hypothetical protein